LPAETTRAGVEDELREAMLTGRLVDWRTGDATADDPAYDAGWDAQRTVPGALLAELLTDVEGPRRPRALRLAGRPRRRPTRPRGRGAGLPAAALGLLVRRAGGPFRGTGAGTAAARLPPAWVVRRAAVHPRRPPTRRRVHSRGRVRLARAHIGGQLDLSGATLTNPDGSALDADGLAVDQDLFCRDGFTVRGEVSFAGAHIGGNLKLDGATLTNPEGRALAADRLTVDGDLFCRAGFTATGEVNLLGAHIGGCWTSARRP
jgi:hypothetical protein